MSNESAIVIVYTTLYRKGGAQFPIVADTIAREKRESGFTGGVVCKAVESKRDLLQVFTQTRLAGKEIAEFHFVGHSGMYGPMFGTIAFPEQFSPYEWEMMEIPFSSGASAYFHCCRSARWFAPYFARTFKVTTYGFFWYTTFSRSTTRYRFAGGDTSTNTLYTIGCKGRKSHGFAASLVKAMGLMPAEKMKAFQPQAQDVDATYGRLSDLYDQAFRDIRVRRCEWKWISDHLPAGGRLSVLDIGCGNGALLDALSGRIEYGAGVDESDAMLKKAKERSVAKHNLEFYKVDSPLLPFPDGRFDVAVSLMSFRYLDWDPLLSEIKRVTKLGGIFLVVDMVTVPVKVREYPRLLLDRIRTILNLTRNREFRTNLRKLVTSPDWRTMLQYNPIRSEHEMKWYLESRFPGRHVETLNIAWNARIVAFDSGPVSSARQTVLCFP
jgi:SAM-dependent methyltransferase